MKTEQNNGKEMIIWIALINFIAFVYGIYYYSDQLSDSNPIYWIFIIDCPLQALLVGILLLGHMIRSERGDEKGIEPGKSKNQLLEDLTNFTAVGAIKYGIWTMIVILFYYEYFLLSDFLNYSILFFAHLGLLLEGLALSTLYKTRRKMIVIALLFYLLNDFFDYVLNTHPRIPETGIEIIALMTISLTFLSVYLVADEKIKSWIEIKTKRNEIISKFLSLLRNR